MNNYSYVNMNGGKYMKEYNIDNGYTDECEGKHDHKDIIKIKENMLEGEKLLDLSELFKALGDPTRIKIIFILFKDEMCVCDIAESLNMTQSAISHQLRTLKNARLVRYRRDGKVIYYSLDDDHIKHIFYEGLNHITE